MACQSRPLLAELSENQIKDEFDYDVRHGDDSPGETLLMYNALKGEGTTGMEILTRMLRRYKIVYKWKWQ